jgi:hypothetical protein
MIDSSRAMILLCQGYGGRVEPMIGGGMDGWTWWDRGRSGGKLVVVGAGLAQE